MKLNKIIKGMIMCSSEQRYGMLKVLERVGELRFSALKDIVSHDKTYDNKSSRFSYNLRKLRVYGVVELNPRTRSYRLSSKGKLIIKTLEDYAEKFMVDDPNTICKNDNSTNHDWVKICRKCGTVDKELIVNASHL